MVAHILPTPEQLRELLRYEPDTGKLYWKPRPVEMFSSLRISRTWNSRYAGAEAFTSLHKIGYKRGAVFDVGMLAHRVAWAIYYGEWPSEQVDHINAVKSDNRLCNLRAATNAENMRNTGLRSDNTSGYKGVSWNKPCGKWVASINNGEKVQYLGLFTCPIEAHKAYQDAAKRYQGEFARFE